MDIVTLAMAKAYSDKKGGYTEPGKTYTFDGNTEGRIVVPFGDQFTFVKIANDTPDLHKIASIFAAENFGSSTVQATPENYILQDVKAGDSTLYGAVGTVLLCFGELPLVVVVTDLGTSPVPETGLYFLRRNDGAIWTSSVEFSETIVPIDQKYLPGVCLPVVELSTTFSMDAPLTDAEGKALDVAFEANTPIIIKCDIDLGTNAVFNNTAAVWSPVIKSNANLFIASFGGVTLTIVNPHGYPAWGCSIMQTEV